MTTVDEIKAAIGKLSLSQRGQLERWLHQWEDDEWDQQIAQDSASGKLDELLHEADKEINTGKLRELL